MTNITLFNPAQLPAFAKKNELSALAKALAGGSGMIGKRISIKGGVFRLIVDGKEVAAIEDRHLDVVIVGAAPKIGRTWFAAEFDADAPSAPDCWSADGEKPDPSSNDPQSTNCASCPQNVKGSGQGESKACRYNQRLAVVLANDIGGDVMQLQLPALSLFGKEEGDNRPLQAYARYLAAQNCSPEMVVTRMRFDTSVAAPKLFFSPRRWLTDEEYTLALTQGATPDAKNAVTMTVAAIDKVVVPLKIVGVQPKAVPAAPAPAAPAPAAPAPTPAAEAPKRGRGRPRKDAAAPAPAPVATPAPAVEEEVPAPTLRAVKAEAAPTAKVSLAKLAAEWDDE